VIWLGHTKAKRSTAHVVPILLIIALTATLLLSACSKKPAELHKTKEELEVMAGDLVFAMAEGEFEEARKHFDKKMSAVMSVGQLEQVWATIQGQAGTWLNIAATAFAEEEGYRLVYVANLFERGRMDIKVVFDNQGQVAGLWAGALEPIEYVAPAYANLDLFEEREVVVGEGKWAFPGTLTVPKGMSGDAPVPAVVLVHGSGPHDRDETIGPNKPFKDLAWGLASRGIAVLRYEKRTKEHAAAFTPAEAASLTVNEETVEDAVLAVRLLKTIDGIDPDRIFVVGHSLGATMGPRIAQACNSPKAVGVGGAGGHGDGDVSEGDGRIAGLVMMAPAARNLADLMAEQLEYLANLDGHVGETESEQIREVKAAVDKIKSGALREGEMVLGAPKAYWDDLEAHDPVEIAKGLTLPILVLQGERDYQVTMVDLGLWAEALSGMANVTVKTYPDLNHLFMSGTGKSTPDEYMVPSDVSEKVVADIAEWIGP
jgi:dienelactone hydrolase